MKKLSNLVVVSFHVRFHHRQEAWLKYAQCGILTQDNRQFLQNFLLNTIGRGHQREDHAEETDAVNVDEEIQPLKLNAEEGKPGILSASQK